MSIKESNDYDLDDHERANERREREANNPNDEPCFDDEPPMHKFIIETYTICDGWIDTWNQNFDTFADAANELDNFLAEIQEDYELGYLSEPYDREDYRIKLVN